MKINKLIISSFFLFLTNQNLFSQIGINTDNLDNSTELTISSIDATYPIVKVSDHLNNTIFTILDNGNVGIGKNVIPKVRLDLRGDSDGAIAVGISNLDAIEAGEGAIRYNNNDKILEYSNGSNWIDVTQSSAKSNFVAIARSNMSVVVEGDTPLKGWTEIRDTNNNFNPSTGIFTASKSGIYAITAKLLIKTTQTYADGSCELNLFYSLNGKTQGIKNVFPIITPTSNIEIPVNSKAFLYLNAGDTIYFSFYYYNLVNPTISDNDALNVLSIVEM